MDEPARYILFNGVIVLLLGLIAGIPYGRSILKNESEERITAWRVAHSSITIGSILMFALSSLLSNLAASSLVIWLIAVLFIVSGYAFSLALYVGPIVGHRGLSSRGPVSAKVVYLGNSIGALTSLAGATVLLYAAWITL